MQYLGHIAVWGETKPWIDHGNPTSPLAPYGTIHFLLTTLRPGENGRHFAHDIFKFWIWLKCQRNLFQTVRSITMQHWFRKWAVAERAKSLYRSQDVLLLTHICVTRVNLSSSATHTHVRKIAIQLQWRRMSVMVSEITDNLGPDLI